MTVERAAPWIILVLAFCFLLQAILSVWDDSPTFDETINPSAGYAELLTGDLSFVHDHPPLYRVFIALPLLAFEPTLPLEHDSWQKRGKGILDRYEFAYEFFYVANKNAESLMFWSRVPVVFLSLLLGLLVFQWAKELYGIPAGLLAFFLYTFEPNIIAHSRLATNDLVLSLFLFAAVYEFWHYWNAPSRRSLILTGTLLGLALLSKFSAVMLIPVLVLLALMQNDEHVRWRGEGYASGSAWVWANIVANLHARLKPVFVILVVAAGVLGIFYGPQWTEYLRGFRDTMDHFHVGHSAFLMGHHSVDGWWYYFPMAFLLKTPIPLLAFVLIAVVYYRFAQKQVGYFLLVPVGVIMASALLSHINVGIRHVLPIYPFLIVLASSVTIIKFSARRFFGSCFVGLGLWYSLSSVSIFPSYLAYFNEFVGPERGYRHLVDSNLDWGQDLKRLKGFMDAKGLEHVYLSYFGTADACYYGIHSIDLPGYYNRCGSANGNPAEFLAVSATNLQSVYLPDKKSFAWLLPYEPVIRIGYSIFIYNIRGDASAHNNLGILYLKYGQLEKALAEFKQVTELSPEEPTAHVNLGFVYARLSSFEHAEAAYRKALQLDPADEIAKAGLKGVERLKKRKQKRL